MEEPGQKLKRSREKLNLRYRDVEQASQQIASRQKNSEFVVALSRLADIENKGTVPSIFKLYSLCAIYRLDFSQVLEWYGVDLQQIAKDAIKIVMEETHPVQLRYSAAQKITIPLSTSADFDPQKTTFISRLVDQWGDLPTAFIHSLNLREHKYGFIGSDDWSMFPILMPGSFVQIDETRRKIVNTGWSSEAERPIYFLEHRERYYCCWCTQQYDQLIVQPHPSSRVPSQIFRFPSEIDVVGQVVGVAMRLDQVRQRHRRFEEVRE